MGDLSGFGFVLGFSPHFPQSPAFLIQVKGTGEEESRLYRSGFSVFCSHACVRKGCLPLPLMAPAAVPWLDLPDSLK